MGAIKREERIGGQRLILGDCLEVMKELGQFDAVVTDPPYGIADRWQGGSGHGWGKASQQTAKRNKWDAEPLGSAECEAILSRSKSAVIWGGNYFPLPPARCWLVWNKPERGFTLAEAELAWTNLDTVVRVVDAPRSEPGRVHPTQKPVRVMEFSIEKARAKSVLDPFMGSGTTLVACQRMGRMGTGIELDPEYWSIACERVHQAWKQPDLFIEAPKPSEPAQGSFLDS